MKKTRENLMFYATLLFLLCAVCRVFKSVTLTTKATEVVAQYTQHAETARTVAFYGGDLPPTTINIPTWIGWALAAAGMVFLCESFIAPKESG